MFRTLFGYSFILLLSLSWACRANANELILQSGQKITGQIIERSELHVIVDVKGTPQTYFLGEVASVDGVKVGQLKAKSNNEHSVVLSAKPKDIRKRRNVPPRPREQQGFQQAIKTNALLLSMLEVANKMITSNRNVVPTPDGGVVIVSGEKIVKYDRNLNIVKEVDLKKDLPVSPK